MKKYKLICMSFDGEYQTERPEFDTVEDAWDYSNNLGSKWYFYPFNFVILNKTIIDTPDNLNRFKNKRIKTTARVFKKLSDNPLMGNADINDFIYNLNY